MSAIAQRIISGPVDPDLDQALSELVFVTRRIRQLEEQIITAEDYANRVRMLNERSDLWDRLATRAEKLALPGDKPGRTLMLMIEEADRLYHRFRRRAGLKQVLEAVRVAVANAERDKLEAAADLVAARFHDSRTAQRVAAANAAVAYLEACQ